MRGSWHKIPTFTNLAALPKPTLKTAGLQGPTEPQRSLWPGIPHHPPATPLTVQQLLSSQPNPPHLQPVALNNHTPQAQQKQENLLQTQPPNVRLHSAPGPGTQTAESQVSWDQAAERSPPTTPDHQHQNSKHTYRSNGGIKPDLSHHTPTPQTLWGFAADGPKKPRQTPLATSFPEN